MGKRIIITGAIALNLALNATVQSYGPVGHEIVGAIADERLDNSKAGQQVHALLEGLTLKKAAVMPDEIKGWDKRTPDDPKSFHYTRHPAIDADLTAYWKANPPTTDPNSAIPSHHWFHYTDVPLVRPEKYEDGTAGRTKWDVVHMIAYCTDVLRGRVPEENERKINKPMAVILLAHFVGDIHQPLHVGAEYFDSNGNVADPDKDKNALADEGGNTLNLEQTDDAPRGRGMHKRKLHGFWDMDTVNGLLPDVPEGTSKEERRAIIDSAEQTMVHEMATHEPTGWKLPAGEDVSRAGYDWANEILPVAREAHSRLVFKHVVPTLDQDKTVAAGDVEEKPGSAPGDYRKWATETVREELHKAGWRLADLLEKCLTPTEANAPH
jgi:hypothetical protein